MISNDFKVIIVGAGPVGLTAAHALHKAGLNFVLLERSSQIVNYAGSDLVLNPLGLRAMSQLNIRESIDAVSSPLGLINRMDHKGRCIGDSYIFEQMKTSLGVAPRVISRVDFEQALYTNLPQEAQGKVLSDKKLTDIVTTPNGVTAVCADGSRIEGSIVVGADGAHSSVRTIMRRLALESGSTSINKETPFLTTYRCLWMRFPRPADLPVGTVCETHGHNAATQLFVDKDTGVCAIYESLDKPTLERIRYTVEDQRALLERRGHMSVLPDGKTTLKDLYESRRDAGMVNLEEGVLDHWSHGRIVLAGDAAHKFTPSLGSGCNNGIIDVMTLVNQLHLMQSTTPAAKLMPTQQQLSSAFASYQQIRHSEVASECARSGGVTGTATWRTGIQKVIDQHVLSIFMVQKLIIGLGAKAFLRQAPPEFIRDSHQTAGLVKA